MRYLRGPRFDEWGQESGGALVFRAFPANRTATDLIQLNIGEEVVGAMGTRKIDGHFLSIKQAADLIVAIADALIELENRKGNQ